MGLLSELELRTPIITKPICHSGSQTRHSITVVWMSTINIIERLTRNYSWTWFVTNFSRSSDSLTTQQLLLARGMRVPGKLPTPKLQALSNILLSALSNIPPSNFNHSLQNPKVYLWGGSKLRTPQGGDNISLLLSVKFLIAKECRVIMPSTILQYAYVNTSVHRQLRLSWPRDNISCCQKLSAFQIVSFVVVRVNTSDYYNMSSGHKKYKRKIVQSKNLNEQKQLCSPIWLYISWEELPENILNVPTGEMCVCWGNEDLKVQF